MWPVYVVETYDQWITREPDNVTWFLDRMFPCWARVVTTHGERLFVKDVSVHAELLRGLLMKVLVTELARIVRTHEYV